MRYYAILCKLLDLWEFVQEKQWFIREHEQLAGISYDKLCGQVDKPWIFYCGLPYDPTGEEDYGAIIKTPISTYPNKRSWQAFQEIF